MSFAKHYQSRITKALVFTGLFVAITFTGCCIGQQIEAKKKDLLNSSLGS